MKKIDLGQTLGLLANVGVIAGIVFLAVEIDQNSDMIQSQTRNEIAQAVSENSMFLAADPEVYEFWSRGQREPATLSDIERGRFNEMATAMLRMWENTHYQYRRGLLDEEEYEVEHNVWRRTAGTEWFRRYYCQARSFYSVPFIEEMEAMMPSTDCADIESQPWFPAR